ncbi:fasciclin domain-containing protein [Phenylobacterium sp. J426]|uniref:fasciclin domain-containing protein n=1 Tax=Phenylobacterium sp. J426 TaxID=2898439 RepID=UPI002150841D|nr:fasciclin domain-containing protein [Phenylobacterium sp. J426]MCR5875967.1 fasciclin domain-containing protein [Phenylobacterium sp. J426]
MSMTRLLSAAAVAALIAGPALAQSPATAKTEAEAKAATGKATSDTPAKSQPQGTARAVAEAAPAVTGKAAPASDAAAQVSPSGDLIDTLKAAGQFTTFIKAADATNLTSLLKTNKNLTVFAPTDAAFAALPASELSRLEADKTAMQKLVLHHVINAPVDSAKIKGARGPVPSGAGDQVVLDGSDEAALKADGATIVQSDIRTGSGLLHVVDKVLVAGQGDGGAAPAGASTDG